MASRRVSRSAMRPEELDLDAVDRGALRQRHAEAPERRAQRQERPEHLHVLAPRSAGMFTALVTHAAGERGDDLLGRLEARRGRAPRRSRRPGAA